MGVLFKNLAGVLGVSVSTLAVASAILTEAAPASAEPSQPVPLQEAFNEAFYQNARSFFQNRSIYSQINWILGQGSILRSGYPDKQIERDVRGVHSLYEDALNQQVSSDPVIRTPDLPNPYDSSIMMMPPANFNSRPLGGELNFETVPLR
ncbi:hypothetical protein [Kamptonema formosum]|uniref:hypothetical protein n=1 Tax=Kamptonema formosum TaxID=331992 RepID=UPI00034D40E7|nr:hypothetical protein [Oscillatoria sp. PCC 10802]